MRELDNRLMRHIDLLVERYASLESARNSSSLCFALPCHVEIYMSSGYFSIPR